MKKLLTIGTALLFSISSMHAMLPGSGGFGGSSFAARSAKAAGQRIQATTQGLVPDAAMTSPMATLENMAQPASFKGLNKAQLQARAAQLQEAAKTHRAKIAELRKQVKANPALQSRINNLQAQVKQAQQARQNVMKQMRNAAKF